MCKRCPSPTSSTMHTSFQESSCPEMYITVVSIYSCWKGDWIHVSCPYGLHFDDNLKYCNWQGIAPCHVQAPIVPAIAATNSAQPPIINGTQPPTVSNPAVVPPANVIPLPSVPVAPTTNNSTGNAVPAVIPVVAAPVPPVITVPVANSIPVANPAAIPIGTSSTLPPVVTNTYSTFTGTYPQVGAASASTSTTGSPVLNNGVTTGSYPPSTYNVTVPTSPYNPLINYNGMGSSTVPSTLTPNVSFTSTVAPVSTTSAFMGTTTTTVGVANEPATPMTFNGFNNFAPFNGFNVMSTMFPWASNGDDNQAAATNIPIMTPAPGFAGAHLNASPPVFGNIFNSLTYPPVLTSATTPVPAPAANQPSQTTAVLTHPESGTVVYVTNNIMTTIAVGNRSGNGSAPQLGQLRLEEVVMNARDQSGTFRCLSNGLFPDPKDISAYIR